MNDTSPTTFTKVKARHILVTDETLCNELKVQINSFEDFDRLARKNSTCPSAKVGGDLGIFGKGVMVPEFDEVVFSAPLNEVQGPVRTQFGYHLIWITSRK